MNETSRTLTLVFSEDGVNPRKWEGRWENPGEPDCFNFSSVRAGERLRALSILFLLAKYEGEFAKPADGVLKFSAEIQGTWIELLGEVARREDMRQWLIENFHIPHIPSDSFLIDITPGSKRGGGAIYPTAKFNLNLLPAENLQFSVRLPGSGKAKFKSLQGKELLDHAKKLEAYEWPKDKSAINDLLRLGTLHDPDQTEKPKKQDKKQTELSEGEAGVILKELLFLVRRDGSEDDCIKFLQEKQKVWPKQFPPLCNHLLNDDADSVLLLAIARGKKHLIDYILGLKELNVNQIGYRGVTPLLKAASLNNVSLVKRLLDLNANPKQRSAMNWNVLHAAAFGAAGRCLELMKIFEKSADFNEVTVEGLLPLSVAIMRKSSPGVLQYLIEKTDHSDLVKLTDIEGHTLVFKAYLKGDYATMVELISMSLKAGDHSWLGKKKASYGNLNDLAFWVSINDYEKVCNALCNGMGTDELNRQDNPLGLSALHVAAMNNNQKMIKLLIDYRADPFSLDKNGRIPREVLHRQFEIGDSFADLHETNSASSVIYSELWAYEQRENLALYLQANNVPRSDQSYIRLRFRKMMEDEIGIYRRRCEPFFSYIKNLGESGNVSPAWNKRQLGFFRQNCDYYAHAINIVGTEYISAAGLRSDFETIRTIGRKIFGIEDRLKSFEVIFERLALAVDLTPDERDATGQSSDILSEARECEMILMWGAKNDNYAIVWASFVTHRIVSADFFEHICLPFFNSDMALIEPLKSFDNTVLELKNDALDSVHLAQKNCDNDRDLVDLVETVRASLHYQSAFWSEMHRILVEMGAQKGVGLYGA